MMAFRGIRAFISRNLLPPDLIDTLHDALRDNGAEVCFCCNPSCNSSTDYHVLISPESEKFRELQSHGCQIVGPQCILRCAKERRELPKQMYTCCLAMENFHVLATGFTPQEKMKIEQLVSSMHGVCDANVVPTLSCVIAKNVLTPKYRLVSSLRKPIVSIEWLYQCWREHRIVPFEPYRLLPFTGLTICATQIPADIRSKISEATDRNGGSYSADLTRVCTHLIANLPEGDKYKVAKRWGSVKLVNQQWFWQSIAAKACLEEDLHPVRDGDGSTVLQSVNLKPQQSLSNTLDSSSLLNVSACTPSFVSNTLGTDPTLESGCHSERTKMTFVEEAPTRKGFSNVDEVTVLQGLDDMYLSECCIHFVGIEPTELRMLSNMVSDGGGTRYVEFNEMVTHVIVGRPVESDLKDIRQAAVWGSLHVVTPRWLEDCTQLKKEVPVRKEYCPFEVTAFKGNAKVGGMEGPRFSAAFSGKAFSNVTPTSSLTANLTNSKPCSGSERAIFPGNESIILDQEDTRESYNQCSSRLTATMDKKASMKDDSLNFRRRLLGDKKLESVKLWPDEKENFNYFPGIRDRRNASRHALSSNDASKYQSGISKQSVLSERAISDIAFKPEEEVHSNCESVKGSEINVNGNEDLHMQDSNLFPPVLSERTENVGSNAADVFEGLAFRFAVSFPLNRRDEIIEWVMQGGGKVEGSDKECDFVICPHGCGQTSQGSKSKLVSSHWIKFCLNERKLLDIESHILYSPLQCSVPLPGFGVLKICISQYEERDRLLLRNLCYVLGAKFTEILNKKVTHLLCEVKDGQKYQAAITWGIQVVTAEWLYKCVAQNALVEFGHFLPKEISPDQLKAGNFATTQFPTQAAQLAVGQLNSQWVTQKQDLTTMRVQRSETHAAGTFNEKKKQMFGKEQSKGKRPSLLQKNKRNASKLATESRLMSHASISSLDPWDELTATWSSQVPRENCIATQTTHQGSTLHNLTEIKVFESEALDVEHVESWLPTHQEGETCSSSDQSDKEKLPKCTPKKVDSITTKHILTVNGECGHQTSDVAAAIEDLLAQTSRVRVKDACVIKEASEDLLCSNSTTMSRRNFEEPPNHSKFKRPKPWAQRSIEVEEEPRVLSNSSPSDAYDRFQDSQLDSQVVGYDEDSSGKQRIMDRVRTRSMSLNSVGGGFGRKNDRLSTWKSKGFGRLFKAAEANK